jgi:hypothetical protein
MKLRLSRKSSPNLKVGSFSAIARNDALQGETSPTLDI